MPLLRALALALIAALALAAAAPAALARSAIVIVVENDPSLGRAQRSLLDRAIDGLGEPAYAALLERSARRFWDRVEVLSGAAARFERFAERLRALDREGYLVDVVLDVHGSSRESKLGNRTASGADRLYFPGRAVTAAEVAALGKPRPLRLNAVYLVACWGSRFNAAWLAAGARAANGAEELNYYVLVSPVVFLEAFGGGADLAAAAERAFAAEARYLDNALVDRLLARPYGRSGVEKIEGARSSRRVHAGPAVRAARFAGQGEPTLF